MRALSGGGFRPLNAWLEYAGLWAIAIAYPLFNGLAASPEAFAREGSGRLDVIVLILLIALIPPSVLTAIEAGVSTVKQPAGIWFRAAVLGTLVGLVVWKELLDRDASSAIRMGLPLMLAAGFAIARVRMTLVRNFTEILSIALPVVIVQFCLLSPVRAELLPNGGAGDTPPIESGTPIVMIVFDEFSLPVLERSRGEIDDRLFPGFARLARESTWYPNALAASDFSAVAVPAILTGEKPSFNDPLPPPSKAVHPDNLCSELASGGYAVNAYEPFTNLCGQSGHPLAVRLSEMVQLGTEFQITPGRLIYRAATKVKGWAGDGYTEGLANRGERGNDFIAEVPGGRNRFDLLHSVLPHQPWKYMPNGKVYEPPPPQYSAWTGPQKMVNAEMQRMMAQLQYTDRRLAAWITELKQKGIWEQALVVVTADHGVNFVASEQARILEADNAGAILPVPLFVKYPGQVRGMTDPQPASTLDIAPTVDDVLEADPPNQRDGRSLQTDPPPPPETIEAVSVEGPFEISRREVERQQRTVIAHRNRLFGSGTVFAVGGHSDLLGRRAKAIDRLRPLAATLTKPYLWDDVDTAAPLQPVLVEAAIPSGPGKRELSQLKAPPIAVAVNGRVATTNRAWELGAGLMTLQAIIPVESLRDGANRVEVLAIDPARDSG